MPNANNQSKNAEDEIDLRALFATLWSYKTIIILFTFVFTLITVIIAYRMPKYYKTTTVIEVKPKSDNKQGGLSLGSLGGAASLLGLGSGSTSTTAQDAAKIAMYRTNKHVIDTAHYDAQFFITQRFRPLELQDDNCSISISGLKISDYRKFGMKVSFRPVSKDKFRLEIPSKIPFMSENLGTFSYDTPIHTSYFDCAIHQNPSGVTPETIVLNGDKHFIFDHIISKNLSASTGPQEKKAKADLPFVTISYLDTIPKRGEKYVHRLLDAYVHQSIGDELDDINTSLSSIKQQIREIRTQASASSAQYEKYRSQNAILSPEAQAKILIEQQALAESKLAEIRQKLGMVNKLIQSAKNRKNIDTMAPALVQLGDEVTAGFIGKLQDLQIEEVTLSQEFTAAYPKLRAVRRQIHDLRSKISKSLISLRSILLDERKMLRKEQSKYTRQLKHGPRLEAGLAPLMRDYKLYETMLTYLLQKRSSLELKRAEALSRFRTIDPIYTNPAPAKPKKALIAIVGLITSFILAIFLVFFREFLREEEQPA
jgi:uncharacterized protein involved in exopolysaccharide biosynthesis